MSNFKLGKTSLKRLQGVHPDLVKVIKKAIKITRIDFSVAEGLRSEKRQHDLFLQGYSEIDGITKKGKHQKQDDGYGHAVDVVPYVNGKALWSYEDNEKEWMEIGRAILRAARLLNVDLIWGLTFNIGRGHDLPHFELKDKKC